MAYNIVVKNSVDKDIKKIDPVQLKRITTAIEKYLTDTPRKNGEPLKGKYKGLWKMYVIPYRVIYEIDDEKETVTICKIGHRKDVYR